LKNLFIIMVCLVIGGVVWSCSSEKKSEEQLYTEANQAKEKGNFREATDIYQRILRLYPESPKSSQILVSLGLIYAQNLKDDKSADRFFQEFSKKYPDGEKLLYDQAQSLSEKGDFVSAVKIYEEILKLFPQSPNSYKAQFSMGFVYSENLKNYAKAKEAYEKVLEKYPHCDLADDAQFMLQSMENDSLSGNLMK
jgi:outer membrane protein assembly factor BamD (BamD/ComL family)